MKPALLILTLVALLSAGCFRLTTGRGTMSYKAKTPASNEELLARIANVRMALRSDPHFVDRTQAGHLRFEGKEGGVFEGCAVTCRQPKANEVDANVVLLVHCPHSIHFSQQARELRKVVKAILGAPFVAKLKVVYDENLFEAR